MKLDVRTPAGDTATRRGAVIWAHGGGFWSGNKNEIGPLDDWVKRGWVGLSIDYRLQDALPENPAVGAVTDPSSVRALIKGANVAQRDIQTAVRWARANATSLGIDPSMIVAAGGSAGAIAALMAGFNPESASSKVAAVVSIVGMYEPAVLGRFPRRGAPPIGMFNGTNDTTVPLPAATLACGLTVAAGNICEMGVFVGQTHHVLGTKRAARFMFRRVVLREQSRSSLASTRGAATSRRR
jgi:predicted esterase